MRPYGWALILLDWYPYRNRLEYIEREDHAKTQGKDSHLQVMERGLSRNQP